VADNAGERSGVGELLSELLPSVRVVAMLINPKNPGAEFQAKDIETAARALGRENRVLKVTTEADFEPAFATLVQQRVGALIVGADPFVNSRREQIIALAARYAVPAIYHWREFVAGGLISYRTSIIDGYRLAGVCAARIIKGAKHQDLPGSNR
jgi:putative tryptophan/tyrosine transport system substrate-binding protein